MPPATAPCGHDTRVILSPPHRRMCARLLRWIIDHVILEEGEAFCVAHFDAKRKSCWFVIPGSFFVMGPNAYESPLQASNSWDKYNHVAHSEETVTVLKKKA